ncbi:four helix bundle protein [Microbulbifer litoralis]|uniref:four helix bundle protein n=1 Tax=Microbulbifer litoralis TaxID=2933965 RepID=UPI003CE529A0
MWRLAMSLATQVYSLTADFPREERYGLSSQLQRSSVSIPSNIAEGNARGSTRDYARFISMAQGSCAELQTQLFLSRELALGNPNAIDDTLATCNRVGQMLLKLHRALTTRMDPESRVPSPESRSY